MGWPHAHARACQKVTGSSQSHAVVALEHCSPLRRCTQGLTAGKPVPAGMPPTQELSAFKGRIVVAVHASQSCSYPLH